ncbi:phage portal protein [Aureimonas jatrophae]|uniref:Phage portal protein, HK97 family n=1 Tax=Aureimonas jatrophae TaxID=1166073 RepID=A0A1H0CPK4_9HYPH|nr:phage portal protein [Aureimonas jatrophae]MBB3949324.1 HK97 family phage portal protein [Aureimonas jatrophae]SDN59794.1 phage portal protein, HK97 family [Aureimonas jatrophae]
MVGPVERLRAWARGPDGARAPERKEGGFHGGALVFAGGQSDGASWSERGYVSAAREGFMRNPVAYRCVRLVAESTAAVPLILYDGSQEVAEHPMLQLLRRPNGAQDGAALVEALCGHLLLSGAAHLEAVALDGVPRLLHALRPDTVRTIAGADGWPTMVEVRHGEGVRRLALDGDGGRPPRILAIRLFHPLNGADGFAPLEAARTALDLHNAATRWNKALLDNSARPSGALVYQPGDGSNLSPDQFDRLKSELESGYVGAARAGRPMLLEGGLDWKTMALSPRDMDFVEARNGAARDIAVAFGVPPMLLGIPGDATYANYAEANRALFRLTVLPLVARLCAAVGDWLAALYGEPALRLGFDADRIEGLAQEREALWRRLGGAEFLSEDEKREAVGYGPRRTAR